MSACHAAVALAPPATSRIKTPLIALAGQPNLGKSTIFNLLTGLNQHVGNWPGKTVERREGSFAIDGLRCRLVDLPGTYSLTASSPEEIIAREFIVHEQPDVVVAVVSAANLERSLYLVAELLALPAPVIVGLNMMDVAVRQGLTIEPEVLQAALGVPVVPLIAVRAVGVRELLVEVKRVLNGEVAPAPHIPEIRADHQEVLDQLSGEIKGFVPQPYPPSWVALKLLEGDAEVARMMQQALPLEHWEAVHDVLRHHEDAVLAVASGRYEWIGRMIRAAVTRPKLGQIGWTNQADRWATHPFWGLAILASVLGLTFWLTFTVGSPVQTWLESNVLGRLSEAAAAALAGAPFWIEGLIVRGLIGGVGAVLSFLPIMMIFFAAFGLLEDTGYMARAAYVMDNLMHVMGLHGKSFLPLFLGFGCNVPAVMGTRVIESRRGRLLTILLAPLMPCSARLAVIAFLAPAFFGPKAFIVSWGIVLFSMLVLVGLGWLLNILIFRGRRSAFIMEMPLYHLPNARTIGLLVWQRSVTFVSKAGTNIVAMAIAVWALSVLPGGTMSTSYLTGLGKLLSPVGNWMGFDWRLTVALIASFPAKENAIATLGVIFGNASGGGLTQTLAATYLPASALAFLVATTLFIPCAATVATMRQETGSWRWPAVSAAILLATSVGAAGLAYRLALAVGL
jgi:ferrous iron transport protein B